MQHNKSEESSGAKPSQVIPEKAKGYIVGTSQFQINSRDAIIYSLGIGFSKDPLNKEELNFTYEMVDNFKIFPTMATVLNDASKIFESLSSCPGLPDFNPMMLLHGEQSLTILIPLCENVTYYSKAFIEDVQDKEKGALVIIRNNNYTDKEMKNLAFINETSLFIRGIGGFEKNKKSVASPQTMPSIPKTSPSFKLEDSTNPNQALLYRLSGDINPLHVDPSMAEMGGFERPILHGLCFYGITARLILAKCAGNDVNQLQQIKARFVGHFFPGETLVVNAWVDNDGKSIVFESKVKERNKTVMIGAMQLNKNFKPKL